MSLVTMGIRLVRLKLQLLGNMTRRQVSPSEFDIGTDGIETQTAFFSKDAANDFQRPCAEVQKAGCRHVGMHVCMHVKPESYTGRGHRLVFAGQLRGCTI